MKVDMAGVFVAAVLVLTMTSLFFVGGRWLHRYVGFSVESASSWSSSYFLGMGFYLSVLRLSDSLTLGFRVSVTIALATLVALSGLALMSRVVPRFAPTLRFVLLWGALFLSCCIWWYAWTPTPGPWTHWGSIHSGRYVDIAQAFVTTDRIIRFRQNLGESAIVASHLVLAKSSPYLALTLHLAASLAALYGVLAAWLRSLGVSPLVARYGAAFVFLCNTSLSLTFVNLIDCGSPLFIVGYVDTAFGLGSLVTLFMGVRQAWDSQAIHWRVALATAVILYSWSFTAPQNIVLISGLGLLTTVWIFHKNGMAQFKKTAAVLLIGITASLVGSLFGGMLMPSARLDPDTRLVSHALDVQGSGQGLVLDPYMFFKVSHYGYLRNSPDLYSPQSYDKLIGSARPYGPFEVFRSWIFRFEMLGWEALRIFFFPILGLVFGILSLRKHRTVVSDIDQRRYFFVVAAGWIVFLPAFGLAFFFSLNGFKHETNRFLYPSILTGLVSLVVAGSRLLKSADASKRWLVWTGLSTVALIGIGGPAIEMVFLIRTRLFESPGLQNLIEGLCMRR